MQHPPKSQTLPLAGDPNHFTLIGHLEALALKCRDDLLVSFGFWQRLSKRNRNLGIARILAEYDIFATRLSHGFDQILDRNGLRKIDAHHLAIDRHRDAARLLKFQTRCVISKRGRAESDDKGERSENARHGFPFVELKPTFYPGSGADSGVGENSKISGRREWGG